LFWEKSGLHIPYIVIYGGTDLNIDLASHEKTAVIERVAMNAIKRICFTKEFVKLANSRWPSLMHTYQCKRENPCAEYEQLLVHLNFAENDFKEVSFCAKRSPIDL